MRKTLTGTLTDDNRSFALFYCDGNVKMLLGRRERAETVDPDDTKMQPWSQPAAVCAQPFTVRITVVETWRRGADDLKKKHYMLPE